MHLLALILASTAPASAASYATLTTVPTWSWKAGEVSRWHLETDLFTPRGLGLAYVDTKGVSVQAQSGSTHVVIDTECTASPEGKNTVLDCTLAYVSLTGKPLALPADDRIPDIYAGMTEQLKPAKIEIVQSADGRIRSFDLQGVKRINATSGTVIELERILLQRAFSLFELPLATAVDDYKRGWKQSSTSSLMMLPTTSGTTGAYDMRFTTGPVSDNLLPINTTAVGKLSYGSATDASSGVRIIDTTLTSQAEFDLALGRVVWRGATIDGRLTVASNDSGSDVEFYQSSALQMVDAFLPNGAAPLSLMASRAPKRDLPGPELSAGLALVDFSTLGMQALFIPAMPPVGKQLGLPTTTLTARVEVDKDGTVTNATVYKGYEALASACEIALRGARFAKTGAAYAVDVNVEFRAEAAAQ